jgi:hypothetical protein
VVVGIGFDGVHGVPSRSQGAPGAPREDDREVGVQVLVAITHTAEEYHCAVIQQGALSVIGRLHLVQQVGELVHLPEVDHDHLLDHGLVALVVRQRVVPIVDAEEVVDEGA